MRRAGAAAAGLERCEAGDRGGAPRATRDSEGPPRLSTAHLLRAAIPLAALLAACNTQDCPARGSVTTYSGSASYDGETGADAALADLNGSIPMSVTVYDATSACTYDGMQFVVQVGACSLWADLDGSDAGGSGGFSASIEPGQSCDLAVAGGSLAFVVGAGSTLTVESTTTVTLGGAVMAPDGGGSRGYIQWSFAGQ